MSYHFIKYLFLISLCNLCLTTHSYAQDSKQARENTITLPYYYIGVKGGFPLGVSSFSSFGKYHSNTGWTSGLYAGYNINKLLSIEGFAYFGNLEMSSRKGHDYWLGKNGMHYFNSVSRMDGHFYSNLYSEVFMQHYGVQLNVDLLQFFTKNVNNKWMINLSPSISTIFTKSKIKTIQGNDIFLKCDKHTHIGLGSELSAGYRINNRVTASLYSGVTYLTGKQMDGLPKFHYNDNFIWDSGIKISFTFGKRKYTSMRSSSTASTPIYTTSTTKNVNIAAKIVSNKDTLAKNTIDTIPDSSIILKDTVKTAPIDTIPQAENVLSIYYEFNKYLINKQYTKSLSDILELLQNDSTLTINVIGWSDKIGSDKADADMGLARANFVKYWFVARGISSMRIITEGGGVDYNAITNPKARRSDIKTIKKENK